MANRPVGGYHGRHRSEDLKKLGGWMHKKADQRQIIATGSQTR
jgi:hypothetical protein